MRITRIRRLAIDYPARIIEHKLRLRQIEVQHPLPVAAFLDYLRQLIHII